MRDHVVVDAAAAAAAVAAALRSCTHLPAGKVFHDHIIRHSLDHCRSLTNLLLRMYANCSALHEARDVHSKAPKQQCDAMSWNLICAAHARNNLLQDALRYMGMMLQEGLYRPNKVTLVSILSASASKNRSLIAGKLVHFLLIENGFFEKDVVLGTAIINMYGKCGSLDDARHVFEELDGRDEITWNSIISIYARTEEFQRMALEFLFRMEHEGILADKATFVNLFSSFSGNEILLPQGKRLHAVVNETGLHADLIVATAILNMYCKSGLLEYMHNIFDRFSNHDTFSWNTLIGAYARHGQRSKAIQLFEKMQRGGTKPDKISYLSILEAYSGEEFLMEAKAMHACITRAGFETDVVIGTALINMYARCGSAEDAKMMFDKMPLRNEFSWNSMIAAYAQNGQGHKAIQLFQAMQCRGIKPDRFTLLSMVNACADELEIEGIQSSIIGTGLESDGGIGSALIYMYSKCGSLKNSYKVFCEFSTQDNCTLWNAMIAAFGRNGEGKQALQLFEQMKLQAILPDKMTFMSMLEAFKSSLHLPAAKWMHSAIVAASWESNTIVATALVNMYVSCNSLTDAWTTFVDMPNRDVISWTAVINAHSQHGKWDEAFELFMNMQEQGFQPDKVTFISILSACLTSFEGKHIHRLIVENGSDSNIVVANALLNMYSRCDCKEDALRIFDKIEDYDTVAYSSIISACANWAALTEGQQIHASIMGTETEVHITVGNALLHLYGKCGSLKDAQVMFEKMHTKDTVTWSVMIAAHAQQGEGRAAIELFDKMQQEGIQPNEVTCIGILSACNHDGLVDYACQYFLSMSNMYGIVPVVDHYDCLIDLFARAGRLDDAENLIKVMPFPSTIVSWTSFLNACKLRVDIERGEYVADQLFHQDPEHASVYIILSNLYIIAG